MLFAREYLTVLLIFRVLKWFYIYFPDFRFSFIKPYHSGLTDQQPIDIDCHKICIQLFFKVIVIVCRDFIS